MPEGILMVGRRYGKISFKLKTRKMKLCVNSHAMKKWMVICDAIMRIRAHIWAFLHISCLISKNWLCRRPWKRTSRKAVCSIWVYKLSAFFFLHVCARVYVKLTKRYLMLTTNTFKCDNKDLFVAWMKQFHLFNEDTTLESNKRRYVSGKSWMERVKLPSEKKFS